MDQPNVAGLKVAIVPDLEAPIWYLEQAVGSGKTEVVVKTIKSNDRQSYIFVAPTLNLLAEIETRLRTLNVANVHTLHSGTIKKADRSVRDAVLQAMNQRRPDEARVIITTTETFRNILPDVPPIVAQHYSVFLDEGLGAVEHEQFTAKGNIDPYSRLLEIHPDGSVQASPGSKEILRAVAFSPDKVMRLGQENLLTPKFVKIAQLVMSDLYEVKGSITAKCISIVALLRPDRLRYFHSVTMVAAVWSQSFTAMAWERRYGVTIEPFQHDLELFDTHAVKGPGMEIYYCLHPDDRASSRNLERDYETGLPDRKKHSERRVIFKVAEAVGEFFRKRNEDFCWNANLSFLDREGVLSEHRMPANSSGLNEWQEYRNVAALGCVNPPSWVKGILLSFLNCDPTDEKEADKVYSQFRLSQTYQTVGRCSLRDRSRRDGNIVVVLSRQCAVELAKLFQGAQIRGCITSLQSFSKLDRERKNAEKSVLYEPRDNKAWCVWRKRHPEFYLTKEEWYRRCRVPLRT